VGMIAPLNLCG